MISLLKILLKDLLIKAGYIAATLIAVCLIATMTGWNAFLLEDDNIGLAEILLDPIKIAASTAIFFLICPIGKNIVWIRQLPISRVKILFSIYIVNFFRMQVSTLVPFLTIGAFQFQQIDPVVVKKQVDDMSKAVDKMFTIGVDAGVMASPSAVPSTSHLFIFLCLGAVYAFGITFGPFLNKRNAIQAVQRGSGIFQLSPKQLAICIWHYIASWERLIVFATFAFTGFFLFFGNLQYSITMFLFHALLLVHISLADAARTLLGGSKDRQQMRAVVGSLTLALVISVGYVYSNFRTTHPEATIADRLEESFFRKEVFSDFSRQDITAAIDAGIPADEIPDLLSAYASQYRWAIAANDVEYVWDTVGPNTNKVVIYLSQQNFHKALAKVKTLGELEDLIKSVDLSKASSETIVRYFDVVSAISHKVRRRSEIENFVRYHKPSNYDWDLKNNSLAIDFTLYKKLLTRHQGYAAQALLLVHDPVWSHGSAVDTHEQISFLIKSIRLFDSRLWDDVLAKINQNECNSYSLPDVLRMADSRRGYSGKGSYDSVCARDKLYVANTKEIEKNYIEFYMRPSMWQQRKREIESWAERTRKLRRWKRNAQHYSYHEKVGEVLGRDLQVLKLDENCEIDFSDSAFNAFERRPQKNRGPASLKQQADKYQMIHGCWQKKI